MKTLPEFFKKNEEWTKEVVKDRPNFFKELENQQHPKYFWIGCSDSRVPATQISGMDPGEIFVHRNIANVVIQTDFNLLSVLQYAVEVIKVEHIIVCGHYGCGGISAALGNKSFGLIDNWLRNIKNIHLRHRDEFAKLSTLKEREDLLVELNVKTQAVNLCLTTIVQEAWKRGQPLNVHGWVYKLNDGRLKDLSVSISNEEELEVLMEEVRKC